MLQLESNLSKLFGTNALPAFDKLFFDRYQQAEDPRTQLFNIESTTRELDQEQLMDSYGLFNVTNEAELAAKDTANQTYSKNFSQVKFTKAIGITDEMIEDDRYGLISKMVKSLGRSAKETEMVSAFNIFNNAFGTETSADGVAIISASHPSQVGNQSNTLASPADLAYSSLAEAEQVFRKMKDGRGKQLLIKPKYLLVSEADRQNALEVVQSPYKANTANNNINALGADGGLTVISSPYLTDSDAWFLLASPEDHGLTIKNRRSVSTKMHEDNMAGVLYYIASYRQSLGCIDWRGIVGTAGV